VPNLPKRFNLQSESHARSKVQEKETATRTGGNLTPASGSRHIKGDVRVKGVLRVENKTTKHKSYSVTTETIEKLENSVSGTEEIPFLQVELLGGAVKFVCIPDTYWDDIIELINASKEPD
jgi:hypothetical protein